MFVDEATIHVKAGNGGDGSRSFRREKYVPKGGPDGGDGGHGASIIFVADPETNTLLDFAGRHHYRAEHGEKGSRQKCTGKTGEDMLVKVPVGTLVHDLDNELLIADMDEPGKLVTVAKGGRGGRGNVHFKSSVNQTPQHAEPGEPGQERNLRLELKLMADVGLAGFPNAGKSTLISACSAARPKVADYPFTTLAPNLGIVELDPERRFVMADIPGLIEGAAQGAGLGHEFLKHIERCKIIIHLVELYPANEKSPVDNYWTIRRELETYSPKLAEKRQVIAVNKLDLLEDDAHLQAVRDALPGETIHAISGATRQGLGELLEDVWRELQEARKQPAESNQKQSSIS
ncbi:MAG: GTPase ObgE [Phycisphaerae bacterium]